MRWSRIQVVALFILVASCAHTPAGQQGITDKQTLEVHFMDVGQGDGILIRTPDGKNYLVDTGPRPARKVIFPYFEKLGIKSLDGIFITHSHSDHAGGLFHFSGQFELKTLYSTGFFHSTGRNKRALQRLLELKVPHQKLRRGDRVELGDGVVMNIYHPPAHWKARPSQLNDFSLIMRLTYGEIDFLLTGDAEESSERAVLKAKLELKSEFLKVGHHGSYSSTSTKFLEAVDPVYAVISCGRENAFGHPHLPTINKLTKEHNVKVYRTDQDGTILVRTDGQNIDIKTFQMSE